MRENRKNNLLQIVFRIGGKERLGARGEKRKKGKGKKERKEREKRRKMLSPDSCLHYSRLILQGNNCRSFKGHNIMTDFPPLLVPRG